LVPASGDLAPVQTADFIGGGSYVMRIVPANCTRAEILAWGAGGAGAIRAAGAKVVDLTTSQACVPLGAGSGGGGGGASWIAPAALSGAVEPGQSILAGGDGSTRHAAGRGRGVSRALANVVDVFPAGSSGRLVILWR